MRAEILREVGPAGSRREGKTSASGGQAASSSGKEEGIDVDQSRCRPEIVEVDLKSGGEHVVQGDDASTAVLCRPDVEAVDLEVRNVQPADVTDAKTGPGQQGDDNTQTRTRRIEEGEDLGVRGNLDEMAIHEWQREFRERVDREEVLGEQPGGKRTQGAEVSPHGAGRQSGGGVLETADLIAGEVAEGRTSAASGKAGEGRLVVVNGCWAESSTAAVGEIRDDRVAG
jgi:hypothetical protein